MSGVVHRENIFFCILTITWAILKRRICIPSALQDQSDIFYH